MTNEEAMREEFDAWHSSNIPQFNGELRYKDVQLGPFDGWQACAEQKDKEIAELSQEIEAGNVGLHHYKKNNDALRAELDTERCISKDLRDDNDMLRENFAGLKNVLHGAQKEVVELSEKILNWERKSESCESKLGQLEANVEVVELREKLAEQQAIVFGLAKLYNDPEQMEAILKQSGLDELTSIKAAEYQRGLDDYPDHEKANMQQEPVAWAYERNKPSVDGQDEWFDEVAFIQPPNDASTWRNVIALSANPFPQQKLLSDSLVDTVCLTAAEIHNLGRGVSDDKAQGIIDNIRALLEAAHGIKGEKK